MSSIDKLSHQGSIITEQSEYKLGTSPSSSRKIRVLVVITVLGTGGATNVVLDLANHLNQSPDFEVLLLTGPIPPSRNDLTPLAHEMKIPTQMTPNLIYHINPLVNIKAVTDLRKIMVEGDFDIVHTHSSVAGVVGRLAAYIARIPVIIHHVHGWGLHEKMSTFSKFLYLNLERLCARFTNQLIVVSKTDIKKGLDYRIADENKFALIYNGIDQERFEQTVNESQIRKELGLKPDSDLVGMIGRLDEQKNPLDFIRAAAIVADNYQNVQFVFIGDGPLRNESERLIKELNLVDKFFLLGYRDDVTRIIPVLKITALSSLWEGLPIVFLEALCAGKPIVANDVDGAQEIVIDGETGYLVTPGEPSEMAEKILTLLNDDSLCHDMASIAKQRSEYYSVDRMVSEIEQLYKDQLKNSHQLVDA
ncbi:MAG: glycosyltransferase family 4 protein [Chloroflexota bacterium]|nr:MAG: glycosyltransferase family 4 protein [Chloroflexota bacterium]